MYRSDSELYKVQSMVEQSIIASATILVGFTVGCNPTHSGARGYGTRKGYEG